MRKKKIELLAPAGNIDSLKAAVSAGCDAVYLGGTVFSARAFAGNFNHEEMIEAIRYCHTYGVRVYVTMNTLLFETEMENAKKEAAFLYEHHADALLVQDLGLFHWLRETYPDFELHCSTQMHIHNENGVAYMKKRGASRIVLARESSIETVRECASHGIDIEVFAYGAICVCYSGQCLMSQAMKNRSGNRGMCAQLCRMKYRADGKQAGDGAYLLSPKDLNVLDRIPELIDAGAASLKIEGRMKRPEYVWLVTSLFRRAIDACYRGESFHVSNEEQKKLMLMFNRSFSYGHLFSEPAENRMNHFRPNHQGVRIGTVIRYAKGEVLIRLGDTLFQRDGLRILSEQGDIGLTAVKIRKNGLLVNKAEAGEEVWLPCSEKGIPKKGQAVQKTTDVRLIEEISGHISRPERKIPVSLSYQVIAGHPVSLTARDDSGHSVTTISSFTVEEATHSPISPDQVRRILSKLGGTPYQVKEISGVTADAFVPVSMLNEERRRVIDSLTEARLQRNHPVPKQYSFPLIRKENPEYRNLIESDSCPKGMADDTAWISKSRADADYFKLPVVCEKKKTVPVAKRLIYSEIGDLVLEDQRPAIAGMTLNCANSYALAFLLSHPQINGVIFSSEVSNDQIEAALDSFECRYGFIPQTYRLTSGRRVLMYIKDGISSGSIRTLTDLQRNEYRLEKNHGVLELMEPQEFTAELPERCGSYVIQ